MAAAVAQPAVRIQKQERSGYGISPESKLESLIIGEDIPVWRALHMTLTPRLEWERLRILGGKWRFPGGEAVAGDHGPEIGPSHPREPNIISHYSR